MFYYINCMEWPMSEGYYQIPTYEDFVVDYTNEELLESFFKDFEDIKVSYHLIILIFILIFSLNI